MTVADHLQAARDAHARYREHIPRRVSATILPGDPALAREALIDAQTARQAADAADPEHVDPIWQTETEHQALLDFYAWVLAR